MNDNFEILMLEDSTENRVDETIISGYRLTMEDGVITLAKLESHDVSLLETCHPNDDNRKLAEDMTNGTLPLCYVMDILVWYQGGCYCPLTPMDIYKYFPEAFKETEIFSADLNDCNDAIILARSLHLL